MKRIFIIHGWGGYPEEGWFPWLKKELERREHVVHIPAMPDSEHPVIKNWISHLSEIVGVPDEEAYFVGHSIGCQAILRYLETLDNNQKIGSIFLVAPWLHLDEGTIREEGEESIAIAKPWIETPIDFEKVKKHIKGKTICLFSDNDLFVPLTDGRLFQKKLNAEVIIEHDKGHFSGSDKITKIPRLFKELVSLIES